jgi:hypothetical protein
MGGIYEVHRSDGRSCHDVHTNFRKDWFRHSEVRRVEEGGGGSQITTESVVIT